MSDSRKLANELLSEETPKVSIICITYNHENFISDALRGFINQKTNFVFEAIIADDCSTDKTPVIIEKYAKEYPKIIKPIYRNKNLGPVPNYRDAVSRAKGKYLAICDGDDYWTDDYKLAKQVEFLDNHPDFSMCCHPFIQTYVDHSFPDCIISPWDLVSEETKKLGYLTFSDFFPINPVGALTAVYRWNLVRQLPSWMDQYKIADLVMHLLHADKGKVGVIDEVMGVYRRHERGLWYNNHTIEHIQRTAVDRANLLTDLDYEFGKKYSNIINPSKGLPLKILFIAIENSIHSYRWIKTVLNENRHDVRLFSSYKIPNLPDLFTENDGLRIYSRFRKEQKNDVLKLWFHCLVMMVFYPRLTIELMKKDLFGIGIIYKTSKLGNVEVYLKTLLFLLFKRKSIMKLIDEGKFRCGYLEDNEKSLDMVIKEFKPDIIHTLHTQWSAYQLLDVRKNWAIKFPVWIHSVWGSDLYLWSRIPDQRQILEELMLYIDYFIGEGKRDEDLAKSLGFKRNFMPSMPAFGGLDMEKINKIEALRPSMRREIIVKGYDLGVGRFRDALIGLIRAKDVVKDYQINVFSLEMDRNLLDVYKNDSGLKINVIPYCSNDELLKLFSRSRISIGCSFSDGVPATMLEAMACGAFPIQTNTAITEEWIEDGISGILVPPDDVMAIEKAIRQALSDDQLVDNAAEINRKTIIEKADNSKLSVTVEKIYNTIGYYNKVQNKEKN